jgi:hypothetical protein
MTPGVFPNRAGHGTAVSALFDLEECHHQALSRYVNKCETLAMKSMTKEVPSGLNKAKLMFPYPTFPGRGTGCPNSRIFSSIATAHNVCLNSHTDDDAIYGVVTNLDSDPTKIPSIDDEVSLYFTFPTLGLAIALRPGDILFFNPTIYHSVSSRCNPQQNIWCTSLYTKNAVVGSNDNTLLLENDQSEVIELARSWLV